MSGEPNISRRKILGSLGSTGVTAFGLNNSISITTAQAGRDTNKVSQKIKSELVQEMKNSSEVQKLKGKITKERGSNWSVNYEKGKYRGISPENGSTFYLCSIPLMFSSKTLSGALVWSSSSKRYTQVSLLDQSAGRNPKDFSEITYTYGDGNVVTNTDVFEAEVNTQESSGGADTDDNIVPPGGGGICYRCGCQEVVTENCTDYNISCIAIMAGSLGISCNPFTGYVACFLGTTFTGILPWVTGDNCNICDNYDVDRTKVGYACEYDSAP